MLGEDVQDIDDSILPMEIEPLPPRNWSIKEWIQHFKDTYGVSVLALLIFVYFNMGFRVLFTLTMKDLFKHYLKLEPAEAQFFSSIIFLPWGLKVFIGMFIDNIRILGSKRNIYLKVSGIMMALSLL